MRLACKKLNVEVDEDNRIIGFPDGKPSAFEYRATMLRVVDGDTVDVDIDLGFAYGYANSVCDCMHRYA